ncbi:MAG: AraC-like DNA-binding protein [Acidimicrobiales bacterium]|jgi:AraC-like DNA-binding protein
MSVRTLLLVASVLSSGLMAGLFFGWAVSVIPGTKLVDDRSYLATMQNINREILNPVFIVAFVITPFVLIVAAIAHYRAGNTKTASVLAADWTVQMPADQVALSRSAFSARFTDLVGEAPMSYVTRWRMYVATDLLRDQQQSIAHVTAQTGYQSEASFSRAFKRVMGHPPSAARRSAASAAALH